MTYGEALTQVFEEFRDYDGLENVHIRAQFQQAYNEIARRYKFQTMRVSETETWTTGTSHTPTGLTRWRGRPELISSTGERLTWARRRPLEIDTRRAEAASSGSRDKWNGHICYSIAGASNTIQTVSDMTGDVLTIVHYSGPKTFSADADEIDLPDDYVYMPVKLAIVKVWLALNNLEGSALQRARLPEGIRTSYQEYLDLRDAIEVDNSKDDGVIRDIAPPALIRGMNRMVNYGRHRHGGRRHYPGEVV